MQEKLPTDVGLDRNLPLYCSPQRRSLDNCGTIWTTNLAVLPVQRRANMCGHLTLNSGGASRWYKHRAAFGACPVSHRLVVIPVLFLCYSCVIPVLFLQHNLCTTWLILALFQ